MMRHWWPTWVTIIFLVQVRNYVILRLQAEVTSQWRHHWPDRGDLQRCKRGDNCSLWWQEERCGLSCFNIISNKSVRIINLEIFGYLICRFTFIFELLNKESSTGISKILYCCTCLVVSNNMVEQRIIDTNDSSSAVSTSDHTTLAHSSL